MVGKAGVGVESRPESVCTNSCVYGLCVGGICEFMKKRELSKLFQDPNKCLALEKEILSILPIGDLQQCENKMVQVRTPLTPSRH